MTYYRQSEKHSDEIPQKVFEVYCDYIYVYELVARIRGKPQCNITRNDIFEGISKENIIESLSIVPLIISQYF